MKGIWAVAVSGILVLGTIGLTQDVFGPHYTSLDGLDYHFQGTGTFATFDVFFDISTGLSNPKKSADFQICVDWGTATDSQTHVPIEIIALDLVSCQPITVIGDSDRKNFHLAKATFQIEPIRVPSGIADITGSYEIVNPAGRPMAGSTTIDVKDVEVSTLGKTVELFFHNADGSPIPNAPCNVIDNFTFASYGSGTTDADGIFSVTIPPDVILLGGVQVFCNNGDAGSSIHCNVLLVDDFTRVELEINKSECPTGI